MDISTFSWQTKVTKMCPKYVLTLHQNWSSQYQIQINRTGHINNIKNRKLYPVWPILVLSVQYNCYLKPHRTWHRDLVVSVSDFGTRGPGLIPGWAIITFFFLFLFSPCNAKLFDTSNVRLYKWKHALLHVLYWTILEIGGVGVTFGPPER